MALLYREKASRYDALQAAFDCTLRNYQRRQEEAENNIDVNLIGAYNKGLSDAYKDIIIQLKAFMGMRKEQL